ncbi:hypothetical protein H5410_014176 [Solanum commersonii]|uniref:Uncharacterized protein n=1 Tax=Solanum commersonii TaxID=4109 RepID=A0A9J5ZQ94_SOLCO|nr:hypothetical protein H5410_014176 [Solanum commersonii]
MAFKVDDEIHGGINSKLERRSADAPVRRCEVMVVEGTRRGRGRPKKYWEEVIRQDLAMLHITEDMTLDRKEWRSRIKVVPDLGSGDPSPIGSRRSSD